MQSTWVAFLPKLRLHPKGKGHCPSKYQRKLKMQVEQRVNMYGLGFFCSEFGFGRHGEKELESFKVEFKENVVFSHYLSKLFFLGPMEILSSVLELALFKTINQGGLFQISVLRVSRSASWSISSSAHMHSSALLI